MTVGPAKYAATPRTPNAINKGIDVARPLIGLVAFMIHSPSKLDKIFGMWILAQSGIAHRACQTGLIAMIQLKTLMDEDKTLSISVFPSKSTHHHHLGDRPAFETVIAFIS